MHSSLHSFSNGLDLFMSRLIIIKLIIIEDIVDIQCVDDEVRVWEVLSWFLLQRVVIRFDSNWVVHSNHDLMYAPLSTNQSTNQSINQLRSTSINFDHSFIHYLLAHSFSSTTVLPSIVPSGPPHSLQQAEQPHHEKSAAWPSVQPPSHLFGETGPSASLS